MSNLIVLYRLQQADTQIEEIQELLNSFLQDSPAKKELEEIEKALEKAQATKREAEKGLKDAELELASLEAEKKKVQDKLYSGKVTNPKELSQLEKDIEQLNKKREKLDERVLQGMDKVEKVIKEFQKNNESFRLAKEHLEQELRIHAAKKEELSTQLSELQARRESLTQSIEQPLLEQYLGLKERKGGMAVVKLSKNTCGGCFMMVPESSIQKAKAYELEFCSSCGRILYLDREKQSKE